MRILDLRPRSVRLMSRLWSKSKPVRGRLEGDAGKLHLPARLAARVADGLTARRVADRELSGQGPFIVSVGNLALGGTGKTPVVTALSRDLAAAGHRGAILTRGYGSPLAGPLVVDPANDLAGDEARLMAGAVADSKWPVIQARRRDAGLEHLLAEFPGLEIVIIEDGHQTARLGRHLDILILDGWTVAGLGDNARVCPVTGPVVPFGPWRESSAGAGRAGIWVLETDEVQPDKGTAGQAVATFGRVLALKGATGNLEPPGPDLRPAILSGIARPEAFENSLAGVLAADPVLSVRCGDHARYGPRLAASISGAAHEAGADVLVTTSKDWIKLQPFWPGDLPVFVAELEIEWGRAKALPELVGERLAAYKRP